MLYGETRPSRVNHNAPTAPMSARSVPLPEYLDADAIAVWRRLAPSLEQRGMLTEWDVDLFGAFCTAVVHHRRAVILANNANVLLHGAATGNRLVKHPAMQVIRDQLAIMATLSTRFGLTPGDRASISIPQPEGGFGATSILD